jgi:hypothetical protein
MPAMHSPIKTNHFTGGGFFSPIGGLFDANTQITE